MSSEFGIFQQLFQQQVAPLLAEMEASANAHDTDRHLAAFSRDSALTFIINGEIIRGWDALRERQRQWWNDGKATGVYAYLGEPTYEVFGKDLGLTTHLIAARASLPDGQMRERQLAFTALWSRRPEGWRIIYAHESSTK
jgi:ketosteroid isomerase-like protein